MVSLREINDGGYLSQGGIGISLAQNIDTQTGRAIVSVERTDQAPAVSGEGEVLRLTLEGIRGGASLLRVSQFQVYDGPTDRRLGQTAEVRVNVQ